MTLHDAAISHVATDLPCQLDVTSTMKVTIYKILILGAGWTSQWLIPLLEDERVEYAATTTTGRDGTIKFKFDPEDKDGSAFAALPEACFVLITFPLKGQSQSRQLVDSYQRTHRTVPKFIQLGSTGIWSIPDQQLWITRHSPYDKSNERAVAEDELMELGGCILNLSGLWGGQRQPRHWVNRVAPTKEKLKEKGSLHMIHGRDVARAIHAVITAWPGPSRWMLTDMFVYDWWALVAGWGVGDLKLRVMRQMRRESSCSG